MIQGVMFPSDLQGTRFEDAWVKGYDSIQESNQDRYMNDFWSWCEKNCVEKREEEGEHTIFTFI